MTSQWASEQDLVTDQKHHLPLPAASDNKSGEKQPLGSKCIPFVHCTSTCLARDPISSSSCFPRVGRKKPEHRDGWAEGRRSVLRLKAVWGTPEQMIKLLPVVLYQCLISPLDIRSSHLKLWSQGDETKPLKMEHIHTNTHTQFWKLWENWSNDFPTQTKHLWLPKYLGSFRRCCTEMPRPSLPSFCAFGRRKFLGVRWGGC